ncbi:MAG TPA: Mg2+ transporter-C family protein [Desulfosporosinus sp.]|nr:Mg2+ transporter-C family protein [Desulfosporosinus sp.]
MHITDYEIALRLLIACVFGGIVGFQRERHDSPAGLRTYILVSLGASLIMMISMYGFADFPNGDPSRLASQVVSGIGFLGAGTILRDGVSVKGLTTAASLWVVAAIGLAVGAGLYYSSFLVTVLVFITLERSIEIYFFSSRLILKITLINKCAIESINCTLKSHRIMVRNITIKLLEEDKNKMTLEYNLRTPFYEIYTEKIIKEIRELDGIHSVEKVNN